VAARSLFNVARSFGGQLRKERARLIAQQAVEIAEREVVLAFPKADRTRRRATADSRQSSPAIVKSKVIIASPYLGTVAVFALPDSLPVFSTSCSSPASGGQPRSYLAQKSGRRCKDSFARAAPQPVARRIRTRTAVAVKLDNPKLSSVAECGEDPADSVRASQRSSKLHDTPVRNAELTPNRA
jgi:hypothetical protein